MADQDKRDLAGLAREWRANPDSINLAVAAVTAALTVDADPESVDVLLAALRPIVEAGSSVTMQTFGALLALMVRSVNTMAGYADIQPQELWGLMAAELDERNRPNRNGN
jgi:hypothetical protein